MTIEILLFDGFDDLDAFGPFEVLRTAGMQVRLVTVEDAATVTSAGGARIVPDGVLGDPELVLVPGGGWSDRSGPGAYYEAQRGVIPERLAERHHRGRRVGSVCTGAMLLAEAGILSGRRAITHHSAIEDLRAAGADVQDGSAVRRRGGHHHVRRGHGRDRHGAVSRRRPGGDGRARDRVDPGRGANLKRDSPSLVSPSRVPPRGAPQHEHREQARAPPDRWDGLHRSASVRRPVPRSSDKEWSIPVTTWPREARSRQTRPSPQPTSSVARHAGGTSSKKPSR